MQVSGKDTNSIHSRYAPNPNRYLRSLMDLTSDLLWPLLKLNKIQHVALEPNV